MFFLGMAFIAVWVLFGGYLVYMGQRQRQLEQEFQSLEEIIEERSKATAR